MKKLLQLSLLLTGIVGLAIQAWTQNPSGAIVGISCVVFGILLR